MMHDGERLLVHRMMRMAWIIQAGWGSRRQRGLQRGVVVDVLSGGVVGGELVVALRTQVGGWRTIQAGPEHAHHAGRGDDESDRCRDDIVAGATALRTYEAVHGGSVSAPRRGANVGMKTVRFTQAGEVVMSTQCRPGAALKVGCNACSCGSVWGFLPAADAGIASAAALLVSSGVLIAAEVATSA